MKNVSLNFGSIKDTILRHSSKTIINEGKAKTLLEMLVSEVKKDPILKLQYLVYKNIQKGNFSKEYLAERYLNQNIGLVSNLNWEDILKSNKEARFKILNNSHVESNPENASLFESIHVLIKAKTQKGFQSFDEENQAYENVINYLTRKEEKSELNENEQTEVDYPKLLSWKYVTQLAVNSFNERYGHLNENEQELFRVLTSDENYKKNYFQDLKTENLDRIENILSTNRDPEIENDLQKFRKKIMSLDFHSNIDDSIINLYELKVNLD